jgi:hypothetical protein
MATDLRPNSSQPSPVDLTLQSGGESHALISVNGSGAISRFTGWHNGVSQGMDVTVWDHEVIGGVRSRPLAGIFLVPALAGYRAALGPRPSPRARAGCRRRRAAGEGRREKWLCISYPPAVLLGYPQSQSGHLPVNLPDYLIGGGFVEVARTAVFAPQ